MLIVTIKLPPRSVRRILGGAVLTLLLLAALFSRMRTAQTNANAAQDLEIQRCIACLHSFGWEVVTTPRSSEVFELKSDLSQSYLALQQEAGFDFSDDIGSMVTRYTFEIVNYPTGETGVLADVLVRDGQVIGGDVRTSDMDGFMHSLVMPAG